MTFHIQIAQERRVSTPEQPRPLAIPIGTSIPTGNMVDGPMGQMPEYVAGPVQLHTSTSANLNLVVDDESLPPDFSDPQFVMVAEWDLKSPYVIVHKGDYSARTMGYAGWPEYTKEEYDALPAPDTPA